MIPSIKKHLNFTEIEKGSCINLEKAQGIVEKLDELKNISRLNFESLQLVKQSGADVEGIHSTIKQIHRELAELGTKLLKMDQIYLLAVESQQPFVLQRAEQQIKVSDTKKIKEKQAEYSSLEQQYQKQLAIAQVEHLKNREIVQSAQFIREMSNYRTQKEQNFWANNKHANQQKPISRHQANTVDVGAIFGDSSDFYSDSDSGSDANTNPNSVMSLGSVHELKPKYSPIPDLVQKEQLYNENLQAIPENLRYHESSGNRQTQLQLLNNPADTETVEFKIPYKPILKPSPESVGNIRSNNADIKSKGPGNPNIFIMENEDYL